MLCLILLSGNCSKSILACNEVEGVARCTIQPGPKGDQGDPGLRGPTGEKGDEGDIGKLEERGERTVLYPR